MYQSSLSIRQLLQHATNRLRASGCSSPRLDAELLLSFYLDFSRVQLITEDHLLLSPTQQDEFESLLLRRLNREPLAYITGKREFYSREFLVSSAVLVPRPETELLVENALSILSHHSQPKVLELGTGSGCISISLLCELPELEIFASDISSVALRVAQENARRLGVQERYHCLQSSWMSAIEGEFECIVSNPPYVPADSVTSPECKFEPDTALYADNLGLAALIEIMEEAFMQLKAPGALLLEIGHGQAADCLQLAEKLGYRRCQCIRDLADRERLLVLEK